MWCGWVVLAAVLLLLCCCVGVGIDAGRRPSAFCPGAMAGRALSATNQFLRAEKEFLIILSTSMMIGMVTDRQNVHF